MAVMTFNRKGITDPCRSSREQNIDSGFIYLFYHIGLRRSSSITFCNKGYFENDISYSFITYFGL